MRNIEKSAVSFWYMKIWQKAKQELLSTEVCAFYEYVNNRLGQKAEALADFLIGFR
jgi:hypothetical protein